MTRILIEDANQTEDHYFQTGRAKKGRGTHGKLSFDQRAFLSWDGEGYSVWEVSPDGTTRRLHRYCLFGASNGERITGYDLGTEECLSLLLAQKQVNPHHIHVAFSFEYDVNMILKDLPPWALKRLRKHGHVRWHGYRIEHRPKKWFQVSRQRMAAGEELRSHLVYDGRRDEWVSSYHRSQVLSVRVYDVFSFFSCSFVAACRQYIPDHPGLDIIERGKDRRSQFGYHELDFIAEYWTLEQQAMVALVTTLRRTLYSAGIKVTSWHGPGAIATFLFKKHNSRNVIARTDNPDLEMASRCAYAGGRFELFRCGHYEGPVYGYDINSAYPYAIAQHPDMATGKWRYTDDPYEVRQLLHNPVRMAYVSIDWHPPYEWAERAIYAAMPMPLFHRAPSGNVSFPVHVENWYHLCEAQWAMAQDESLRTLKAAWIYEDDGSYPFEWVVDVYEQRLKWKSEGNPAELANKLGINSLYGKTAQRVGWDQVKNLPPTFHQLDYAGKATALCRSMLWIPMVQAYSNDSLISVETDGIFSTKRLESLPNGCGQSLGQWKETVYEGITVLQSGMYWLKQDGEWLKPKTRGIPRERLDHNKVLAALRSDYEPGVVRAQHTSFVGYGRALASEGAFEQWRTWIDSPREYRIGGDGKRLHDPGKCHQCQSGIRFDQGLHPLRVGRIEAGKSTPHFLPWRDGEHNYHEDYDQERTWGIRT